MYFVSKGYFMNMTPLPHLYYNLAYSYNIIYEY